MAGHRVGSTPGISNRDPGDIADLLHAVIQVGDKRLFAAHQVRRSLDIEDDAVRRIRRDYRGVP
jgi:hypothetical protein